jgi:hypothetical protein
MYDACISKMKYFQVHMTKNKQINVTLVKPQIWFVHQFWLMNLFNMFSYGYVQLWVCLKCSYMGFFPIVHIPMCYAFEIIPCFPIFKHWNVLALSPMSKML